MVPVARKKFGRERGLFERGEGRPRSDEEAEPSSKGSDPGKGKALQEPFKEPAIGKGSEEATIGKRGINTVPNHQVVEDLDAKEFAGLA